MKISETAKEYGRGTVGGLLFSLPLLYTMEVWWTGFTASPGKLLVFAAFTFLLLLGYNKHSGMRKDASLRDILHESIEDIAIAFTVAFLFLLLINKINFTMPLREISGKVIVESMIVAIGVSVGTAQLGQDKKREGSKEEGGIFQMIVLSICGAVLIASAVAPTEEILKIALISGPTHLLAMIIISLGFSAVILFFSDFKGTGSFERGGYGMIVHLIISYMCALIISLLLLWFFGRTSDLGWSVIIAETVVLAIPGSLGASAGRMLIG